jgi:hypothetical protein
VGSPGLDRTRAIPSRFPFGAVDIRSLDRRVRIPPDSWRADGAAGRTPALKVLARRADGDSVIHPPRTAGPRRTLR